MNKKEIILKMQSLNPELTLQQLSKIIDSFILVVSDALAEGSSVTLVGLGKFHITQTKERAAYNFSIDKCMVVPAMNRVHFKPSKPLKDKVNAR